jgi:MbtH protein
MDNKSRTNPFDDEEGNYLVLVNNEGQYSLWPERISVPMGWDVAHTSDDRQTCLDFITEVWTDMRPRSLREYRGESAKAAGAREVNGIATGDDSGAVRDKRYERCGRVPRL